MMLTYHRETPEGTLYFREHYMYGGGWYSHERGKYWHYARH